MPLYRVILHASHNSSFSFTITFTFNDNKGIVEVHYNVDNNILRPSLIINNIYKHSPRSVYLSIFYSKASLLIFKVYRFNKFYPLVFAVCCVCSGLCDELINRSREDLPDLACLIVI